MTVGEERKLVTVLFADLVGSTALAHDEDPERVRMRLDRFYDAMAQEIERTGGTVEKFAGDGVMAVFGTPAALEDHAERALHAALSMQRRLEGLFGDELRIRIGVNSGEVIVGQARESSSFVTGDAVNVGARLEQAAAPGEVLAGERTVAAARGAFEFGSERVVEAKGKPGGVIGHPVLRALTLMRPRGVSGLHRVFVGRDAELALLEATYRRAVTQDEPHVVTIVGEPGVGKTRLVRELWELLSGLDPTPLRRTGRCLAYGDGITYWPVGEMVKEHYGIREGDSSEVALRRIAGREHLGLVLGLDVARDLHPLDARERLQKSVVRFVEELAAEKPAVVLVEDIHWADDDLLDLLERVARDARAPVVLLTTTRPELLDRRSGWGSGRRNTTTIWLEPLPSQTTSQMLGELLAIELPESLRDLVVERAEGNPLFVEEVVGGLVDAGVLERTDGTWSLHELPEGFSIPDSVHGVLAARIDRLPVVEKAAIQAAAIVGRVFWPSPVLHLLDGAEPDFELLEERDFIRRRAGSTVPGEAEYAIKHALTREVAYASIPKARRGRLHASLADWLNDGEGTNDEYAGLLAYHYAEAARPEDADLVWRDDTAEYDRLRAEAVVWLARAGSLARGRYEVDEAVELFTRAVDLCTDERGCAALWRELGEAQALRYDGEGMRAALVRSLEGPLTDTERGDTYALLAFQASLRSSMWSIRLNSELIHEWATRALELAAPESEARVRAILARAGVEPIEASEGELREAVAIAERLGSVELRSFALGARSFAAFERRAFGEAATWCERRLELLQSIEDPDQLCEAYEASVPVVATMGRIREAHRLSELHRTLAERLSAHHRVHSVSLELELGDALADWETMAARTANVWNLVSSNLATPCVRNPRDLLLCGLAHLCRGDEARAAELERDAARLAGEGYESYLAAPRLRVALQLGDRTRTADLLELPLERAFVFGTGALSARLDALVALGLADRIEREAPQLVQHGTIVEPFALRALGFARRDDELLARADDGFAALGLEWHRAQTGRLLEGL